MLVSMKQVMDYRKKDIQDDDTSQEPFTDQIVVGNFINQKAIKANDGQEETDRIFAGKIFGRKNKGNWHRQQNIGDPKQRVYGQEPFVVKTKGGIVILCTEQEGGAGEDEKKTDAGIPRQPIVLEKNPVFGNESGQVAVVVKKNYE
jgi:hypothetical protein